MMQRMQRAWAFGRHIPPSKLARRFNLALRRRLRDRRGPRAVPRPPVQLKSTLPEPLFPPRTPGAVQRDGTDWVIRFLGRTKRFADGAIDWMASGSSSGHQLWRMNLHYMEYLEETDAEDMAALVEAWLTDNAVPGPGSWRDSWNAYTLSIRVVVWLQQMARHDADLDQGLSAALEDSLARQVHFLTRNLETDIGGNHLIKNIKALLWAGAAFEGPVARGWQELGQRLLLGELAVQILPDGVHYERSPSYHTQVFADLMECRAVLPEQVPTLDAALARMAQTVADLAHPDGYAAQFNDAGLHMAYAPATCLKAYAAQVGPCPHPQVRFAYPNAGYFGSRDGRLTIIADCGALAPDDLPAHGHGDMLSFELSLDAQRMIVDQGVFEYIPGPRRALSRAAAAHNTLAIEGIDQADFFGAFRFGRRGRITACEWHSDPDTASLRGAHDGYATLPGRPHHVRCFKMRRSGLSLSDRLEGRLPAPAAQLGFLLHPNVTANAQPDRSWHLTAPKGARLRLVCSAPIYRHDAVWWPDMGREVRTTRLVASLEPGWQDIDTDIEILSDVGATGAYSEKVHSA